MLYEAIHIIQKTLNSTVNARIGNIAEILTANNDPEEIIISLINVEENKAARDPKNYIRQGTKIKIKNPAVHLNITLLFTSARSGAGYELGIQKLQQVIEFFQKQNVFDHSNTSELNAGIEKLILEMVSLNLEQLHQLWSMLGGRYYPDI